MIHNPQHYARDFYFFKRAQYPQLSLVHKKPAQAFMDLQRQCFLLKFVEIGKVMLTWGVLKNVNHVVQRVVFLHEDLMKLPSFPRKALEAELDLYVNGDIGKVRYKSLLPSVSSFLTVHFLMVFLYSICTQNYYLFTWCKDVPTCNLI